MRSPKFHVRRGFTLIELLVVVSIIALLSSIVLTGITDSRTKARDTRRVSDMRQLQFALELFRQSNQSYPNTLDELVVAGLLPSVPVPPVGTGQSAYAYARYGTFPNVTFYHLGAVLENRNLNLRQSNCRSGTDAGGNPPQCQVGQIATSGGFNGVRSTCTNGGADPDACYDTTPDTY